MLKEIYNKNNYIATIDDSNFEQAKKNSELINLAIDEEHRLRDWFMYDGGFYFLKYVDNLNEFIGEYLAIKMKLNSAHYIPIKRNNNILVASENFKKFNCIYLTVNDISEKVSLDDILNNPIYKELRNNIFKMFSVDMYMRQLDRSIPNVLFQVDVDNKLTLAPVFDYSNAFCTKQFARYDNPILDVDMDKKRFDLLMNKYPELYNYVKKVMDIDLDGVLKEICFDHDFCLTDEYRDYYLNHEEESKKILRKLI